MNSRPRSVELKMDTRGPDPITGGPCKAELSAPGCGREVWEAWHEKHLTCSWCEDGGDHRARNVVDLWEFRAAQLTARKEVRILIILP